MKINQNSPAKENKISLRQKLLLVFIALSMIPLFFAAKSMFAGLAQTKNKQEKVIKKVAFDNEPIEFLNLESNGKTVKPNEKFIQEGDWLKDFTIKFKNISDKPIVHVSIAILFPETGSSDSPQVYFLRYGVNPEVNNKETPSLLAANDTAEIKFSDKNFNHLKEFLSQRKQLAELTEANFRIMVVYFEDGTKWSAGTIFRPDPNSAGKFIPADSKPLEEEK